MLEDVTPESVSWLWPGRIPLGKITVLDGDPGVAKSTVSIDLAARVSTGQRMPDGEPGILGGVVILSAEDDVAATIRPRLDAAGGDPSRVLSLITVPSVDEDRPTSIPEDLHYIRTAAERVSAKLIIIDPLMAYLGAMIDSHKDSSVRRALHRLSLLAEETGAAVLIVRHLNKASGGSPLYRGGGSIGIIGAARAGLLIARDPEDDTARVLAATKCNLAREPESLSFRLEDAGDVPRVLWGGVSPHRAGVLLMVPDAEERSAIDEACEFLKTTLAEGAMLAKQVKAEARDADISDATLRRAKARLGVDAFQATFHGPWLWEMPSGAHGVTSHIREHLCEERAPVEKPQVSIPHDEPATPEDTPTDAQVLTLEGEHLYAEDTVQPALAGCTTVFDW